MFLICFAILFTIVYMLPIKFKIKQTLTCDPTGGVATMALMATAGAVQAYGQVQEGKSQNSYYQYLAATSRMQGEAELARSQKQAEVIQDTASIEGKAQAIKTAEAMSSQRAALAASGVSGVTAQDITLDTLSKAKMDELMIRRNADVQSWSQTEAGKYAKWQADQQAAQYGYAGKQAKRAGNIGAFTTILGTAASMGLGAAQMGMFSKAGTGTLAGKTAAFGGGAKAFTPLQSSRVMTPVKVLYP